MNVKEAVTLLNRLLLGISVKGDDVVKLATCIQLSQQLDTIDFTPIIEAMEKKNSSEVNFDESPKAEAESGD